jgi:hypothetical protein
MLQEPQVFISALNICSRPRSKNLLVLNGLYYNYGSEQYN